MKTLANANVFLTGSGVDAIRADLHRVITGESRGAAHQVADMLMANYDSIYAHVAGRTAKLPLVIPQAAHFVTGSRVLERHLLWPGRISVPEVPCLGGAITEQGLDHESGDVTLAAAKLHQMTRDAAADGVIDADEELNIRRQADKAIRELTEVLGLLDSIRERGGFLSEVTQPSPQNSASGRKFGEYPAGGRTPLEAVKKSSGRP